MRRAVAALAVVLVGAGYAGAADHPDSRTAPLQAGCNRSNLAYLGESTEELALHGTPELAPEWAYVVDPAKPGEARAIRTLEGRVLYAHTAGQDLFGNHTTYDLNVDVKPDRAFENLLSTKNTQESPPQIHTEWESGLAPLWSWPTAGDRVRETGSFVWDCGHWQEGDRQIPHSDDIPGDPLGDAGIEKIGGENAEIHPISELATWRAPRAVMPPGSPAPVRASQLDVYISNQGGGAKSVVECALAPSAPDRTALRAAQGGGCSTLQDVTGHDYTYELVAPPRPSRGAKLRWLQVLHASHRAVRPLVSVHGDRIRVTIPFSKVRPSTDLQDFGATYDVWWTGAQRGVHTLRVRLDKLVIYNNLDGDSGQPSRNDENGNRTVTPNGEWNVYLDIDGLWRPLHSEMKAARSGDLGNIPTKDQRRPYLLSRLAPTDVDVVDGTSFQFLVDARDCDLPGFTDCPAGDELAFSQNPGRAALAVPVSQLIGRSTSFVIHPAACGTSCDENHSDRACLPTWCYGFAFTVTDVGASVTNAIVSGDGTRAGSAVDGAPASSLAWWLPQPVSTARDQDDERPFIGAGIRRALAERAPKAG